MSERMDTSVDRMAAALSKIMPIRIDIGPEYANLVFADGDDGECHPTQAMTMNPTDWREIQAAYEALSAPTPLPSCPVCGKGPSDKDDARGWCTGCSENVPDTTEAPLSALQRLGQEFDAGEPIGQVRVEASGEWILKGWSTKLPEGVHWIYARPAAPHNDVEAVSPPHSSEG